MSATGEGYVKYTAEHTTCLVTETPHWAELNNARTHLHKLGLVGANSDGIGFGNVSARCNGNEFIISGTATGAVPVLALDQYCLVNFFDIEKNRVVTSGPVQASAESMSHGAVYQSCTEAECVIHIHSKKIFDKMLWEDYVRTPKDAEYGTPEIALAIGACVRNSGKNEGQIIMAGHDEGIIAYGPSIERAFNLILELYVMFGG